MVPAPYRREVQFVQFMFNNHVLDPDRRELDRGDSSIAVEPQVFDLLLYLVENRERVVSKDDLIASVWRGRIVSESTLASRINAARRAIGDSGEAQQLIRTLARRGVRFVGEVSTRAKGEESAIASRLEGGRLEGGRLDGGRLEAATRGERPAIAVLPFTNAGGEPEQDYF